MHQLLAYADESNPPGNNIDTIQESTETLADAGKEIGPSVNAKRIKYMMLSCRQNAGQNQHMRAIRSFENVTQFKYLGMTVINQI
jgi:hypothetical protein